MINGYDDLERDTWGVWNVTTGEWVKNYSDSDGFHKRQGMNYMHAVNAARKMNYSEWRYEYEARDMAAEKSYVEEDAPKTNLVAEIARRKEQIAQLQKEVDALELAQSILA